MTTIDICMARKIEPAIFNALKRRCVKFKLAFSFMYCTEPDTIIIIRPMYTHSNDYWIIILA